MPTTRDQRADARRNVAAILDTAQNCLSTDPQATVAHIAEAAGVGRVTLYGHFKTRAELVDAVLERVSAQSSEILDAVDTSGDPAAALVRLAAATWEVAHRFNAIRQAAEGELPEERIRTHHDVHLRRLDALIARGQRASTFRRDVPRPCRAAPMRAAVAGRWSWSRAASQAPGPTVATSAAQWGR